MFAPDPATLAPGPRLLARLRAELAGQFDLHQSIRISRAPGRLDVMGGIADYTGSVVCEATLDRATAIALQGREDREVHIHSFNLADEKQPADFRISLDELAARSALSPSVAAATEGWGEGRFADTHRLAVLESSGANPHPWPSPGIPGEEKYRWAGYVAGCLCILHRHGLLDLASANIFGLNLAILSDIPPGAGLASSAALEVATMLNLLRHFNLRRGIHSIRMAEMCREVENSVVGAPCGIMDQAASCVGEAGTLMRMLCQPSELLPPLRLPEGIHVIGINSGVRHDVGGGMYGKTRCAAFMAHRMILDRIRQMGLAKGATLTGDPMRGYLANLDADDYKHFFRPYLPVQIDGKAFLEQCGPTIDTVTTVDPAIVYHVQSAADHHVLEARRVRNFVEFLEAASRLPADSRERERELDKAGHLMYASHHSYTNDALLGADECDLLVRLVRESEPAGFYGAKITGGGSGGTVAVLADIGPETDAAIEDICRQYQKETGRVAEAFIGTGPGAWETGTAIVTPETA